MLARLSLVVVLSLLASVAGAADRSYDGTREGFLRFLDQYGLADWASPEWVTSAQIGYFTEPSGVNLRYGYWPRAEASTPRGTVGHFSGRTEFIERNILTYGDLANEG